MKNWFLWLLAGILSLVGGIFALWNPLIATFTAEQIAGWMFVFTGILTAFSAFNDQGWGSRILAILLGILLLLFGIDLIAQPLAGTVSLTVMAGIFLIIAGIFRIIIGFGAFNGGLRWIMILAGVLSIALAVMIFSNFPGSALVTLGIFLAVELISNGISLIVLSLSRKEETI